MTPQELEILISHTMKAIYSVYKDSNLTDAEFDYFLDSILYNISFHTKFKSKIRLSMEIENEQQE